MNRPATFLWLGVTAAVAFGVFMVSYEARHLGDERDALSREISANQQAIHVLEAEWSYLNRPERLQTLAARYLDLEPIAGSQLVGLDTLPRRAPDEAPAQADETLPVLKESQ